MLVGVLAAAQAGCGLAGPARGEPLGGGIARARFETRGRHTDVIDVDVVFPADPEGRPVGADRPALVLIQGGFVDAEDYVWLGEALARRGYVVALPHHPDALAFFAIDNGRFARDLLVSPPAGSLLEGLVDPDRIAVGGHSLGGVVSVKLALAGGFGALVVLASYPDPADVGALPDLGLPSLSLAGRLDCSAPLDEVETGWQDLPSPTALVVLDGVTHFQFTASQAKDEARGCPPEATLADAHARIEETVARFLGAALAGEGLGELSAVADAEVRTR